MDHGCKVDIAKEGLVMSTVETWKDPKARTLIGTVTPNENEKQNERL